jgi:hypothetical protein
LVQSDVTNLPSPICLHQSAFTNLPSPICRHQSAVTNSIINMLIHREETYKTKKYTKQYDEHMHHSLFSRAPSDTAFGETD